MGFIVISSHMHTIHPSFHFSPDPTPQKGTVCIHDFKDNLDPTHERTQDRFLLRNAHVWGLKRSHGASEIAFYHPLHF